jgi:hypothetical protein
MARRVRWLPFLLLLPTPLPAAPPRAGGEFRANSYTTGQQFLAAVSADAAGRFVVVWECVGQDGDNGGIFGQRFNAAGVPQGAEFQVNEYTTGRQSSATVALAPGGEFLVVWTGASGQDGSGTGLFGRRYDANGVAAGNEFRVNDYTTGAQFNAQVDADSAGSFLVAWQGSAATFGIQARTYASGGAAGAEFTLSESAAGYPADPGLAMAADGTFVAVWRAGLDGSGTGVFARRFDAAGTGLGPAFAVNTYTTGSQSRPRVALTGGGAFAVVWQSDGQDGAGQGVFGRRFDGTGAPLAAEFALNTVTTDAQQAPEIVPDGSGGFLVVWEQWGAPASPLADVAGRQYDGSGVALDAEEFVINTTLASNQRPGGVASDPDGRFVVAWHGNPSDGGGSYAVLAQRFGDLIFKDGFEQGGLSAWSAAAGGPDLAISGAAGLAGTTTGVQATVDDTEGLFVQDDSPADEGRYRARFYLDTNGFDPGETQSHFRTRTLIAFTENPTRRVAAVVLRRIGNVYAVMGRARRDDNTQANTGFFSITDGAHAVEIELLRATGPDANDGALELWIDGASMIRLTGLDNSLAEVDFARMGALSVKTGATGTLYFDEFESRRQSYIDLLP